MKQKYFYLIAALAMAMMTQSSCISDDFDPEPVQPAQTLSKIHSS